MENGEGENKLWLKSFISAAIYRDVKNACDVPTSRKIPGACER